MINLWLDDVRPAPEGWIHVKTVDEAKGFLIAGEVLNASLDHDLGACDACLDHSKEDPVYAWMEKSGWGEMPNCEHFGTGYTLVCWMEETGYWPVKRPAVHSANPVGRDKMLVAIWRHYAEL